MLKELETAEENFDKFINENDFSFINHSDIEILNLEKEITAQKDILAKLEYLMNLSDKNIVNLNVDNVVNYTHTISNNIDKLINITTELNKIKDSLKNLLISIEIENNNHYDYTIQISSVKHSISEYASHLDDVHKEISENTKEILNFLENMDIPEYLSNPHIETNHIDTTHDKDLQDTDIPENNVLTISEKLNQVILPYTKSELKEYLKQYPDKYSSYEDVISKEYIYPLSYYTKYHTLSRFREMYSLIRDREGKSILEALKYGFEFMFRYELNPAIIAACKTQSQFETYLYCLDNNCLEDFHEFIIKFDVRLSNNYNHSV